MGRFMMTPEANAPQKYKQLMVEAKSTDTQRSLIFSGRPMRVFRNAAVKKWEGERLMEQRDLLREGKVPMLVEAANLKSSGTYNSYLPPAKPVDTRQFSFDMDSMAMAMGQGVGA